MKKHNITLNQLIEEYKRRNNHYFDKETLKHWGERLSDMRILENTVVKTDFQGNIHECIVLSKISKDFYGKKYRNYDYFDIDTLNRIID
ncbi:MAG: hypothetical protein E6987_01775 [Peptoniphilus harei]|nr:hypothetical protein [Peptoniphilus harei]